MSTKLSVDEIKAIAEIAITTRQTADAAKKAYDDALGSDGEATLKTAYEQAESDAVAAKAKADALSQDGSDPEKQRKVEKLRRKRQYINDELQNLGEEDDDDDDEDNQDDLDKPVTRRELQQIKVAEAAKTAIQMADAIPDAVAKAAVKEALKRVVPSGDPQKDFTDAVAIANREKNSKVLEEIARKPAAQQHSSGAGAPPKPQDAEFVPTSDEARFMKPPFNLTKEDILRARSK